MVYFDLEALQILVDEIAKNSIYEIRMYHIFGDSFSNTENELRKALLNSEVRLGLFSLKDLQRMIPVIFVRREEDCWYTITAGISSTLLVARMCDSAWSARMWLKWSTRRGSIARSKSRPRSTREGFLRIWMRWCSRSRRRLGWKGWVTSMSWTSCTVYRDDFWYCLIEALYCI